MPAQINKAAPTDVPSHFLQGQFKILCSRYQIVRHIHVLPNSIVTSISYPLIEMTYHSGDTLFNYTV